MLAVRFALKGDRRYIYIGHTQFAWRMIGRYRNSVSTVVGIEAMSSASSKSTQLSQNKKFCVRQLSNELSVVQTARIRFGKYQ